MHPYTRRGFLGASAAALAAGLTACGSSASSNQGAAQAGSYTPPGKDLSASLRYAIWDATQLDSMKEVVQAFNQTYPNIKVDVEVTPFDHYWTKLQTEASSSTMPDVFWMNPLSFELYASGNKLLPSKSLTDAGVIKQSDYPKPAWDMYNFDGVHYGVPKDNDAIAIWYNKKIFKQYDIDPPKAPWTWKDLTSKLQEIKVKSKGKVFGMTGPVDSHGNHSWYNGVYQAGGYILSDDRKSCGYDQPGTIEGVKFWADMVANKYLPSIKQLTDTPFASWFTSGRAAMSCDGSWQLNSFYQALGKDLDVAPWASGSNGNPTCVSASNNMMPAKPKADNKDASLAFLQFFGGKKAAEIQAKGHIVIPAYEAGQGPWFTSAPGVKNLAIFKDAIQKGFQNPHTLNTAAWQKVELDALLPVFQGKQDAESACKALKPKIDALLAKE